MIVARQSLALAALCVLGACGTPSTPTEENLLDSATRTSTARLATPGDQPSRIGIYNWNVDVSSYPGYPDRLNWGANLASSTGTHTLRVYLGTRNDYQFPSFSPTDLVSIAQRSEYTTLFNNSAFTTYFLTVYSQGDAGNNWVDGFTVAEAQSETTQIQNLGYYLLTHFPSKKFIILNWEGDNALAGASQTAWDGYVAWINSRTQGVRYAQSQVSGGSSRLFAGLEFNKISPCDTGSFKCVLSYVAPYVDADVFSYSSWSSLGTNVADASLGSQFQSDLSTALWWIQQGGHYYRTRDQVVVGEFGFARDVFGECESAQRASILINALEGWGASYGIFWQVVDNPSPNPPSNAWTNFGLYKYDGTNTLTRSTFTNLYFTGYPSVPGAVCSSINPGGVVNGVNPYAPISAGTVVSIYGTGFSGSNLDKVHVQANGFRYTVSPGSYAWYDGTNQINAQLPYGIYGQAVVYVTNGQGVDSNGQLITLQ